MAERKEILPDKRYLHALLVTLFHEKWRGNGYADKEMLRDAMIEEMGNNLIPSDEYLRVKICELRKVLHEVNSNYEIETITGVGYKIVKSQINNP